MHYIKRALDLPLKQSSAIVTVINSTYVFLAVKRVCYLDLVCFALSNIQDTSGQERVGGFFFFLSNWVIVEMC